jgi:hypothetical protein
MWCMAQTKRQSNLGGLLPRVMEAPSVTPTPPQGVTRCSASSFVRWVAAPLFTSAQNGEVKKHPQEGCDLQEQARQRRTTTLKPPGLVFDEINFLARN